MSEDPALIAAKRLATFELAHAAGALFVTLGDGRRLPFASQGEMAAMIDEMKRASAETRVRFRPNAPPGSLHAMPVGLVSLPEAVSAALHGIGAVLDDNGNAVLLGKLGAPAKGAGFLRDLRTR